MTLGVILVLFGVLVWRLVDIGWRRHSWYAQTADAQANGISNVLMRGHIYLTDVTGQEQLVATNKKFPVLMITASVVHADAVADVADQLSRITELPREQVYAALTATTSGSRPLMRKLTDAHVAAIQELNAAGVSIGYETDRSYPAEMLAADAIGFLGYDKTTRVGQYGIESSYDEELAGHAVSAVRVRWDVIGQLKKMFGIRSSDSVTDDMPQDISLTLDPNIQAYAQTILENILKKYSASSGVLIVEEPTTGKILALADSPTFNPNHYGTYPIGNFLNGALVSFEPGSSFKPFTMAMGLDLKKITPTTTFNDMTDVVVDGYPIKNFNEGHFGLVTMTKVLEKSINTGVMWVEQEKIGNDRFLDYVVSMGFGQRTGIDLPGESPGDIKNLYSGRRINFMTASFGQGIMVTPIQLINGYSAIANGGELMKPYVVAVTRDAQGRRVETEPEVVGTPFTATTAATLRSMLTSVVDNGFDKARIPRYDIAGKTGTAQIASPEGGYLEDQYNHSFIGFAPASDPKFVILIKMEKPQGVTFAADSLSPAFKDMATFLLEYLHIPPTR